MMSPIEQEVISIAATFGITNKLELAHMLARFSVESGGFTRMSENLNYTPEALLSMWPKRFTPELANKLGRTKDHKANQVEIAKTAYGNRMGNEKNGTNDNDGWDYRGGGITQLTGVDNYLGFLNWLHKQGKHLELDIKSVDEFVHLTFEGQVLSGMWYWLSKGCGVPARKDNVKGVCLAINGGSHGLEDQIKELVKYKKLLGV